MIFSELADGQKHKTDQLLSVNSFVFLSFYLERSFNTSDGTGSKIFDLGWPWSIFCCSGWVGSTIFGLGMTLENFP